MAVVFGNSTTVDSATGTSITLTKPSGLAAGNMMFAFIGRGNNDSAGFTRSGWTVLSGVDYGDEYLTILAKIADSTDAAASNFAFTGPSSSNTIGAMMYVTGSFTSVALNTGVATDTEDADATPTYTGGVTPRADSMLLLGSLAKITSLSSATAGSYAIQTDNPTWTERVDVDYAGGTADLLLAVATATRPEATATGTYSLTITSGQSVATSIGFLIYVFENIGASGTADFFAAEPAFFAPTPSAGTAGTADFFSTEPTFFETRGKGKSKVWTDQERPDGTWINETRP